MANSTQLSDTLKERLDFINLDQRAVEVLKKLQPCVNQSIGAALDALYSKVRATPDTRRLFRDESQIARAKSAQEEHWGVVVSGTFSEDYVNRAVKIGHAHAKVGLEPRWYISGYALVIEKLIHAVVKEQWPRLLQISNNRPDAMAESLSCLVKAALLDMDFAISAYLSSQEEMRRRADEAVQEAIGQERAVVTNSIGVGLAKLAAKDLSYRMASDLPEAYCKLQADFNVAAAELEEAMQHVRESTGSIRSGTDEISTAADDLSRRTEQQAASLEETAAALEEITATVRKSSEGANHARQVVASADEDAKKSSLVVRQAVEAMDAIAKSAGQISQIIGVIDEIAFQTNLLALNAGVEAARAGDAGRGFAVVASEVRALAQRSAEAAKEIKGLITASARQVEHGVKLVDETGSALDRIMAQVSEINTVVGEIAAGAREQSTGLAEVNTAINQMDQVTQQNAAMVEESTAACHSLSQETEQLSSLIGQFRLGRANDDDAMRRQLQKVAPHAFQQPAKAAAASPRAESRKAAARPARAARKMVANGAPVESEAEDWKEF